MDFIHLFIGIWVGINCDLNNLKVRKENLTDLPTQMWVVWVLPSSKAVQPGNHISDIVMSLFWQAPHDWQLPTKQKKLLPLYYEQAYDYGFGYCRLVAIVDPFI